MGAELNNITGKINRESTGELLYRLSGRWSDKMWLQCAKLDEKILLFDAKTANIAPKITTEISDQEELESRRLVVDNIYIYVFFFFEQMESDTLVYFKGCGNWYQRLYCSQSYKLLRLKRIELKKTSEYC